jgi:hypothetical protein
MGFILLDSSKEEKHGKDHTQFQKVSSQKEKPLMPQQVEYSEKADLIQLPITAKLRVVQVVQAIILQALIPFSKTRINFTVKLHTSVCLPAAITRFHFWVPPIQAST